MATWSMLTLQDSASIMFEHISYVYYFSMEMMCMILMATFYMLMNIMMNVYINRNLLKHHFIEIIWTLIPMLVLVVISFPSLKTLYFVDEIWNPIYFTIKCVGHQWYWSYEYSEFIGVEFSSYMIDQISLDTFRLLDVDNVVVVPMNMSIRFLVTSVDVIHSWAIPSLGIKIDAVPGRINQVVSVCFRPGLYFGQCSEICGTNHSFMPIVIECTSYKYFNNWINSFKNLM